MCIKLEISDILSLIAILVSLLAFWLEYNRIKKESDAKFFQDIYFKYMKQRIPIAEAHISFNTVANRVDGISEMIDVIKALRKKSSPYRFIDEKFYTDLVSCLEEIEDFYIEATNTVRDQGRFETFQKKSRENISKIYQKLNKKFQNKKQ